MPQVVREDIGQLGALLTITLSKEDYEPKLTAELSKYRKKVQMKGFRKGKTPQGLIRKMYGRSILAETINELFQTTIQDYLTEEKLEILGQPIPAEEQEEHDFDINQLIDYVFKVELGLAPEFEVKGLSNDNKYSRYAVEIPEDMIEKDLMSARNRVGERVSVDDGIEGNDLIALNAEELDGEEPKENGWACTFNILVDLIADEELKNKVLASKKGDKIRFNIYDLEKDRDEDYVRKYFLNVTEEDEEVEIGNNFEATIADVTRVQPAELDQEFFDKYFGEGKVKSEEEARDLMKEDILKHYNRQAESLLFRDLQERLMEENRMDLPNAFLKRWLKAVNENATDELIEKEFDAFTKNLRWSLVRGKLIKRFDVKVTEDEIFEGFKDRIRSYFGGYGDELVILNTANRMMEDRNQVDQLYQELMSDKLFKAIRDVAQIEDNKISTAEFDKVLEEVRAQAEADRSNLQPENTTEEISTEEEELEEEDVEQ